MFIGARPTVVDSENDVDQGVQRAVEMRIGDLVTGAATFGDGDDKPTTTETGQVIRHICPGQGQITGQLCRVAGLFQEVEEDT